MNEKDCSDKWERRSLKEASKLAGGTSFVETLKSFTWGIILNILYMGNLGCSHYCNYKNLGYTEHQTKETIRNTVNDISSRLDDLASKFLKISITEAHEYIRKGNVKLLKSDHYLKHLISICGHNDRKRFMP